MYALYFYYGYIPVIIPKLNIKLMKEYISCVDINYLVIMVCLLLLYLLATSKVISGRAPIYDIRPPAQWPDILLSHIIWTQSKSVLALS